MEALFNLKGETKTLEVYEDHCVIKGRKSFYGVLSGSIWAGAKEFYYADMTAVQYRKAGTLFVGFIQFEYPGSPSGENNLESENSFVFYGKDKDLYDKAYRYIKERISYYKQQKNNPQPAAVSSTADELKKFKELLDSGVITEEEFNAKKKELLGL